MKKMAVSGVFSALLLAQSTLVPDAQAASAKTPKFSVKIDEITNGKPIPAKLAYCMPDGKGATKDGGNISPAINWSGAPANTKSYVLVVVDKDVPASFEKANKPDQTIPDSFPRQNFYHWVLVDIPTNIHGLLAGKNSDGVTKGGKPAEGTEYGVNGVNGYGFGGYDGPCPPWNDERLHRYHFIVYALDTPSLALPNPVKPVLMESAMKGHIIAQTEIVGTYTNNPKLIQPPK